MNTAQQTHSGPSLRPAVTRRRINLTPVPTLAAALTLLGVAAAVVAAQVTVWALDETVLEQSAVHYSGNLPSSLIHDLNARATNRLYSLILSVAFRLFHASTAIGVDHVLSVLMFISTAVPVYLLCLRLRRTPWEAVAIALLSVALPWLTLTTALFTENLSYPLFWWAMLAGCEALWRPSARNDALTVLAVALLVVTRIQFVAVFAGYLCAVAAVAVLRRRLAPHPSASRSAELRTALGSYPVSAALLAVGILALLYLVISGQWNSEVTSGLGTYSNVVIRNGLPSNMVEGLLVELMALALGVGLLPAIVSLTWLARRIVAPSLERTYIYLLGAAVMVFVFLLLTDYSQFGYLGQATEERYFFYVVPGFWIAAFAALRERTIRPGELVVCGLALAAVYGSIPFLSPLTEETAFLAPSQSVVQHVLTNRLNELAIGLTPQDALALIVALAGGVAAFLSRLSPGRRMAWTLGLAAALQLLITGYAYAVVTGHVSGITGRTIGDAGALGWVDSHSRTGHVAWLDNSATTAPPSVTGEDQARTTLFWNKTITTWEALPQTGLPVPIFPMSALPGNPGLQVNTNNGELEPPAATASLREIVGETASPFLQLKGEIVARAPGDGLTMIDLALPAQAEWLAEGLANDGSVPVRNPVTLLAFPPVRGPHTQVRVTFTFTGPAATRGLAAGRPLTLHLVLGKVSRAIALSAGQRAPQTISVTGCVPEQDPRLAGTLTADRALQRAGLVTAGVLEHVQLSSAPVAACPR